MVSGEWDSGIRLFLLAKEGVSGSERSPGGSLCRGANHVAFLTVQVYHSSYRGERRAYPGLQGAQ